MMPVSEDANKYQKHDTTTALECCVYWHNDPKDAKSPQYPEENFDNHSGILAHQRNISIRSFPLDSSLVQGVGMLQLLEQYYCLIRLL
jgi:hypothetical protein